MEEEIKNILLLEDKEYSITNEVYEVLKDKGCVSILNRKILNFPQVKLTGESRILIIRVHRVKFLEIIYLVNDSFSVEKFAA